MLTRFNRPFQRTKWPSRVKSNAVSLGTRSFPSSSNFNISISIEDIMMTEDAQQCQRISSSIFEFSENLSKYFELNIYLEGSLVSLTHHKHLVSISRLNKNKKQTKKKDFPRVPKQIFGSPKESEASERDGGEREREREVEGDALDSSKVNRDYYTNH